MFIKKDVVTLCLKNKSSQLRQEAIRKHLSVPKPHCKRIVFYKNLENGGEQIVDKNENFPLQALEEQKVHDQIIVNNLIKPTPKRPEANLLGFRGRSLSEKAYHLPRFGKV